MTLIVGYGNILRSDDGIGIYLAKQIAQKNPAGVTVKTMQQLHVELLEEMIHQDKTIFIDAASEGEEVGLKKIEPTPEYAMVSSHFVSPELLLEMGRSIYGKELELYLCSVRGESFDLGDTLSAQARKRGKKAIQLITEFLSKGAVYA